MLLVATMWQKLLVRVPAHVKTAHSASSAAVRGIVCYHSSGSCSSKNDPAPSTTSRRPLGHVPAFKDFVQQHTGLTHGIPAAGVDEFVYPAGSVVGDAGNVVGDASPRIALGKVYMETFGCQMNVSDSEIISSILKSNGYTMTTDITDAQVILTNTCAIREHAESKVWQRLGHFKNIKVRTPKGHSKPVVGVLGCMAERLKSKLLESDRLVDIVAGPDSYRDLPRLIAMVSGGMTATAVNVQLSQDETYADVAPVRSADNQLSAFVAVTRGCNNMCSFCIVPFTRGRERSRAYNTIKDEILRLRDSGFKEVTLLGQNVNSFCDQSTQTDGNFAAAYHTAEGFANMYKLRDVDGVRFAELLARLSEVAPEMRFRFTSPHPKDFPDELLTVMKERSNICKQVHLPAQSGSTTILAAMRRGYTRESYLQLAHRIRASVPGVALSSDFITGFCGENEEDHLQTLRLIEEVAFEQAFMFAYSKRDRTHAAYKLTDDVPQDVKQRRLAEVISTFRKAAATRSAHEVGTKHVVLIEGNSKRSSEEHPELVGRTDNNKRCVLPAQAIPDNSGVASIPQPGEYVQVCVQQGGISTLHALATRRGTLQECTTTDT
jgi:tRNA-N(6)-(isopentenyl)adenosine-37 thiotransferase enzyme MiaB